MPEHSLSRAVCRGYYLVSLLAVAIAALQHVSGGPSRERALRDCVGEFCSGVITPADSDATSALGSFLFRETPFLSAMLWGLSLPERLPAIVT